MNRTVIVTGASRGIGRACAVLFAEKGYNVVINFNKSEREATELLKELRDRNLSAVCIRADVSNSDEVCRMVKETIEAFGSLDVLVCNAGMAMSGLITDFTDDDWRKIIGTNLDSQFYCARAVLPHMINRKSGKIINVSSVWGICGASCEVAYSASKAGVIGFTKALAQEVGPSGITVNCVAPGVIDTDMNADLSESDLKALCDNTPLGRLGTAGEVAALICFLASSEGDFITGQVISPNGGFVI